MQNFIGELRMFGGNFAPRGWALCAGQLLSIAQNDTLYALIGTTYGGDGVTTFGLPDLRGRIPVGQGQGQGLGTYVMGQQAGTETVTLSTLQIPQHNHGAIASLDPGSVPSPGNTVLPGVPANAINAKLYVVQSQGQAPPTIVAMSAQAVGMDGGSQPHDNVMPSLCVNYIIALEGIFPSRN